MNIDELALRLAGIHTERTMFAVTDQEICNFARALIAEYEAAGSEPVGWWHQGAEEGESDFHLYESHAGEDCETCIPLYARPDPRVAELEAKLADREGLVCGDCDGSGWLENSVEGQHPCTCMTEAEPYQLLEAQNARLQTLQTEILAELNKEQDLNTRLLAEIKAKGAALESLVCAKQEKESNGKTATYEQYRSAGWRLAEEALALSPSAELLEARDRKRDAKLIRIIVEIVPNVAKQLVEDWARVRESGEWKPELGE